nr:YajG family lipoprotein [Methylonatrum kenyense]
MLLTSVLLAACATTGQVISLSPSGAVDESDVGVGREVAVRAVNERDRIHLGTADSRIAETEPLVSDRDLSDVVTEAAKEALRRKGFRPVAWDSSANRRLTVRIRELEHNVSSAVPRQVRTRVELAFDAANDGRSLSGSSRSTQTDAVTVRPSPRDNAEYINKAIDGALRNLYNDRLMDFLANP